MSVTQTIRFPDDVHAAFKEYCDRKGSNPNAETIIAVRKHIGMPTVEERLDAVELELQKVSDRLNKLETSAIATQQSSEIDTQSSMGD